MDRDAGQIVRPYALTGGRSEPTGDIDMLAMVWPIRGYLGLSVRCFMPGSMT